MISAQDGVGIMIFSTILKQQDIILLRDETQDTEAK